jgi:hypothetical protein
MPISLWVSLVKGSCIQSRRGIWSIATCSDPALVFTKGRSFRSKEVTQYECHPLPQMSQCVERVLAGLIFLLGGV